MDLKDVINILKIKRIFPKDGKDPFFDAKNSDVGVFSAEITKKNVIERSHPRKIGSILNGVDDDFSTPFFVFTKYLRNAIK